MEGIDTDRDMVWFRCLAHRARAPLEPCGHADRVRLSHFYVETRFTPLTPYTNQSAIHSSSQSHCEPVSASDAPKPSISNSAL